MPTTPQKAAGQRTEPPVSLPSARSASPAATTAADPDKLPQLIDLKYHTVRDAIRELGEVQDIREVFVGFQRNLY